MGLFSKLFGTGRRSSKAPTVEVRPLTAADAWRLHATSQAAERAAREADDPAADQMPGAPLGAGLLESTLPRSAPDRDADDIEEMRRRIDESRQRLKAQAL